MGQAKLRGDRNSRVAEAIKKIEELKPDHIVCNNCQANLVEIVTIDSRGMKGIEAAFAARCSACGHDTWAVSGDPDSVEALYMVMESETGGEVKTGIATSSKALK